MDIKHIQYIPSNKPIHVADGKFQFNTMSSADRAHIFDIIANLTTYQINKPDINFANAFILHYFKQLDEKQYFYSFVEYIDSFNVVPAKNGIKYLQHVIENEMGKILLQALFCSSTYSKYLYLQRKIIKAFLTALFDLMNEKQAFHDIIKNTIQHE